jgi:FG-GAP-like repeat/Bacterial cadherin-like domain
VVGDFNGDSDPDLAVANDLSDDASVLLSQAGAGFAAATNFAVGDSPGTVVVGDFNGDSDPDLAVSNFSSNNVSVLLGETGGNFAAADNFPAAAGHSPVSVAVGDFNGDSDPDLAVANRIGTVSVLLGDGGGGFAAADTFFVGDQPFSVAVGDFDGDFDPDPALTKPLSDNVAVLLNIHAPAAAGDAYGTDEDRPLDVAAPGVLGNDTDRDGDGLEAVLVSGPPTAA